MFTKKDISFSADTDFIGAPVFAKAGARLRADKSTSSTIVNTGTLNQLMGYVIGHDQEGNFHWWKVSDKPEGKKIGWIRDDAINFFEDKLGGTQASIKILLANDAKTNSYLVLSAEYIRALNAQGKDTTNELAKLDQIRKQYNDRQLRLRESKFFKSIQYKPSGPLKSLIEKYDKGVSGLSGIGGIGVAPLVIAACVLGAILVAGLTFWLVKAFEPDYTKSQVNLKESQDLTDALKNLSPEVREKIKQDLNKQIDDAYNQGKTDESGAGIFSNIKSGALLVGGIFVGKFILDQVNNTKKK